MSARPALTLLGRPGCHLCHEMRELVVRTLAEREIDLVERNIEDDEGLLRRYALAIPVLLLGETELARYRISEEGLREALGAAGLPG